MSRTIQWVLMIFLGGLGGYFAGDLLATALPQGLIRELLEKSVDFGLKPPGSLDLKFLTLTLGFEVKLNLTAFVGLGLALYFGKHIR